MRMGLRGTSERLVRVERGAEVLASHTIRLWAVDDYIMAFPLGGVRGGYAFDPFVSPLPRSGGVAFLLHRSLRLSAPTDEEHSLDDSYVLAVFRSGLPQGATASCNGEVLWTAEHQSEARRTVPDLAVSLSLSGGPAHWGGIAALTLPRPPVGFVPHRALVGGQSLVAHPDSQGWRFPGFALLPGLDALRRRGRVDGFLAGERVTVPAMVFLGQVPGGAALNDGAGWRPLNPSEIYETGRDGRARLWVCLPDHVDGQEWTIFEGPRPVTAYREQGVRLAGRLFGFGEALRLERRHFNLNGSGIPLAEAATDTGVVVGCEVDDAVVRVCLATPIAWTERHKALAWSAEGISELVPVGELPSSAELAFEHPPQRVDGVCLFHGPAWLGGSVAASDHAAAVGAFLAGAVDGPEALRLAVAGRLPILAPAAIASAAARLQTDSAKGLLALCRASVDAASAHVIGRLLSTWAPRPNLAEALVAQFLTASAAGKGGAILERLTADAPCSTIRVVAHGLQPVPRREQGRLIEALILRMLPSDAREVAGAEQALLARALEATRFDQNFLASRAEGSIASLAWTNASAPTPPRQEPNLATALTIAPVRRWLAVHLLARLATLIR